jgi:hypothetical protein
MKTYRTYRLPTLNEFSNCEIKNKGFNDYYYITSDVNHFIDDSVVLYNPIDLAVMSEHKFYEYNLRLIYEENGEFFWKDTDEVKENLDDWSNFFTFREAEEHIYNLNAKNARKNSYSDIKDQIQEINEGVESIKNTYEEQIDSLEEEVKKLKIIIEYLENKMKNEI